MTSLKLWRRSRHYQVKIIVKRTFADRLRFYSNIFGFIEKDRFREISSSHLQLSGVCISRFHPKDAVLACVSSDGQVTIFKGANGSIPFSDWRIKREFKFHGISSFEWNVSYSFLNEFNSIRLSFGLHINQITV